MPRNYNLDTGSTHTEKFLFMKEARSLDMYVILRKSLNCGMGLNFCTVTRHTFFCFLFTYSQLTTTRRNVGGPAKESVCGR